MSTYAFGWNLASGNQSLEDLVRLTRAWNLDLLQIGDHIPLHHLNESALGEIYALAHSQGVTLETGARGLTPEKLKTYIQICEQLHSSVLRFIIDEPGYHPSEKEIIALINEQVGALEKHKIALVLENHDLRKAEVFAEIIRSVNHPLVGICLDTANSLGIGESIGYTLSTLLPYTLNLHVKDIGIKRLSHMQGFVIDGRIAGQGMLQIPELLQTLAEQGKCRSCVLEQWVPRENNDNETNEKEIRWAKESIAFLQHIFRENHNFKSIA